MRFAHTNKEVPKSGASKREAESSTASEQAPATKTSRMSSHPRAVRPEVDSTIPSSTWDVPELGPGVVTAKMNHRTKDLMCQACICCWFEYLRLLVLQSIHP